MRRRKLPGLRVLPGDDHQGHRLRREGAPPRAGNVPGFPT